MNKYLLLFLFAVIGLFSSCDDGFIELQSQTLSQEMIEEYIAANNLTGFIKTDTGLNYKITEEGEGTDMPTISSTVDAHYVGYLLNGDVFDTTEGSDPLRISLQSVVAGWTEGFQLLKKSGKATFIIPPHLGYGTQDRGTIPPNSVLIFEVELLGFF